MLDWIVRYDGYSTLGKEDTPDYLGYVVWVGEGESDAWYVYIYNRETGFTEYLDKEFSEDAARAALDKHHGITR